MSVEYDWLSIIPIPTVHCSYTTHSNVCGTWVWTMDCITVEHLSKDTLEIGALPLSKDTLEILTLYEISKDTIEIWSFNPSRDTFEIWN